MGCGASSASVAAVEDSVPSPQPLAATAAPDARGAEVRHDDEQATPAGDRPHRAADAAQEDSSTAVPEMDPQAWGSLAQSVARHLERHREKCMGGLAEQDPLTAARLGRHLEAHVRRLGERGNGGERGRVPAAGLRKTGSGRVDDYDSGDDSFMHEAK